MRKHWTLFAALLAAPALHAATPTELLDAYARAARAESPGWPGPSVAGGRALFVTRHGEWSCSTCHTPNPAGTGRHAVTGKTLAPLAPAANADRFTDSARVEKWFRRNCNDTLRRPCTAAEKADVIAYLMTVRGGT